MNTKTRKLYSRVFRIFLPNFIKIDPYNFELQRFKAGAFWGHSVDRYTFLEQDICPIPALYLLRLLTFCCQVTSSVT